jgi:hypothetical protein
MHGAVWHTINIEICSRVNTVPCIQYNGNKPPGRRRIWANVIRGEKEKGKRTKEKMLKVKGRKNN